jgi:alkylhydroperoxidase family enzyme
LRGAARPGREAPPVAAAYLEQVRRSAYSITDSDVATLREAGLSEDEIFEHTVAAAVDEGLVRLAAALEVLP